MMNKDIFWQIIDKARNAGVIPDDLIEEIELTGVFVKSCYYLINELKNLDDYDLLRWKQIYDLYRKAAFKNKLWVASYVINGINSYIGFDHFRCLLIANGKEIYLKALYEPDDLADIEISGYTWEYGYDLLYLDEYAYKDKYSLHLPSYKYHWINDKFSIMTEEEKTDITSEITYSSDIDIDLSEGNDLKMLLPKLCKKYDWKGKKVYIANPNEPDYFNLNLYNLLMNKKRATVPF